jgi:hypothetical protein
MKNQFVYWLSAQDVLVENALQGNSIDVVVPHTLGINDQDGSASADPQAIRQGAFDALGIAQFGQAVGAGQLCKLLLQRQYSL